VSVDETGRFLLALKASVPSAGPRLMEGVAEAALDLPDDD